MCLTCDQLSLLPCMSPCVWPEVRGRPKWEGLHRPPSAAPGQRNTASYTCDLEPRNSHLKALGAESAMQEPGWDPGHFSPGQVWPGTVIRHRQDIFLPSLPPALRTPGVDPEISTNTEIKSYTVGCTYIRASRRCYPQHPWSLLCPLIHHAELWCRSLVRESKKGLHSSEGGCCPHVRSVSRLVLSRVLLNGDRASQRPLLLFL